MRQIGDIINHSACLPQKKCAAPDCVSSPRKATSTPSESYPDWKAMVALWTQMEEIYPHKWSSKLGQPEKRNSAFQTWRNGLTGMTPQQIAKAIARCILSGDPWPPSLPQFRRYGEITPEELGLPNLEDAYQAARQQRPDWSQVHPIIYHLRQVVGLPDIIVTSDPVIRPRFEQSYQALVARALAGETFTVPTACVPQLAHQPPRRVTAPGEARVHLQALRARLTSGAFPEAKG